MIGMMYGMMKNQGYHLELNSGKYNACPKMGPNERAENYRADMIDAIIDERLKYERRRKEEDDEGFV